MYDFSDRDERAPCVLRAAERNRLDQWAIDHAPALAETGKRQAAKMAARYSADALDEATKGGAWTRALYARAAP